MSYDNKVPSDSDKILSDFMISNSNNWSEAHPDMLNHDFEIFDNKSDVFAMDTFHAHSFYEFRFILSGNTVEYNENSTKHLFPGCVSLIPPGIFHRADFIPDPTNPNDCYERLLVYVSSNFIRSFDTDKLHFSRFLDEIGFHSAASIRFTLSELKSLCRPLRKMVQRQDDSNPIRHLDNQAAMVHILISLMEKFQQSSVSDTDDKESSALIYSVISYINNNLSARLSLDDLAERFFVNKFYLAHQFKDFAQLSVHQYILARRMIHAQNLLKEGTSPIETAAACGYTEYSSFYKAFLRETGVNPQSFAKK